MLLRKRGVKRPQHVPGGTAHIAAYRTARWIVRVCLLKADVRVKRGEGPLRAVFGGYRSVDGWRLYHQRSNSLTLPPSRPSQHFFNHGHSCFRDRQRGSLQARGVSYWSAPKSTLSTAGRYGLRRRHHPSRSDIVKNDISRSRLGMHSDQHQVLVALTTRDRDEVVLTATGLEDAPETRGVKLPSESARFTRSAHNAVSSAPAGRAAP